jgi:hypothetical protein
MPTDTSTTFEQEDDPSSARSVLDFLYHDSRRIGSFLSQFEGDGHLQQLTRTKDAERGKKEASKKDGKADLGLLSGGLEGTKETTVSSAEGYARVFDPYWANARAFLDYLSENNMINRTLLGARIGQFVLVKGYLSVLDLSMMKDAWKLQSIQRKALGGSASQKLVSQMTAAEKAAHKEQKENSELTLDMMQLMPHAIHASLITDDEVSPSLVWGALREEYLATSASDITLAHGARMSGTWTIVGILTALPEYEVPDLDGEFDADNIGMLNSMVGQISQTLAPIVRFALGRPAAAYAVTPLTIFREVA